MHSPSTSADSTSIDAHGCTIGFEHDVWIIDSYIIPPRPSTSPSSSLLLRKTMIFVGNREEKSGTFVVSSAGIVVKLAKQIYAPFSTFVLVFIWIDRVDLIVVP